MVFLEIVRLVIVRFLNNQSYAEKMYPISAPKIMGKLSQADNNMFDAKDFGRQQDSLADRRSDIHEDYKTTKSNSEGRALLRSPLECSDRWLYDCDSSHQVIPVLSAKPSAWR